jgi:alkanesulfonate monooxygenase SsuD/methylene tetrahydromethanopterin reductase-like flavin-dependent oxidoreductase (luciferase family)
MSVKPIIQLYPVVPANGSERETMRPIGRNSERYQKIIRDWAMLAQAADQLGYWGFSTIEHHFHSEGYEVGPNPGVLNAWWANMTRNIHLGALGYVMSTQNPVRVAEECAILDHILQGRFFAGFARGYQARWANIIGQHYNSKATLSDGSADDELNRQIFEEQMDIVLKCWTQDAVTYNGKFFKIPYPYETGVQGYPAYELARKSGANGEIGANNEVRTISVVPAPYQKPHPPIFVATSSSKESAIYCGKNGFVPVYFSPIDKAIEHGMACWEAAKAAGHNIRYGERQALVRWIHVTDSYDAYRQAVAKYDVDIYVDFYSKFFKDFDTTKMLADPVQSVINCGLYVGGTAEDVREQLQSQLDRLPAEYLVLIWHWAQQPTHDVLREMERFAQDVLPKLDNSGKKVQIKIATTAPGQAVLNK